MVLRKDPVKGFKKLKIKLKTENMKSIKFPGTNPSPKKKREKRNCYQVYFAVPADDKVKVKVKESNKLNKYLDLTWKLKRQWNMEVTVIPVMVRALGTILMYLEKDSNNWSLEEELNHPNHSTGKIGLNSQESPGDLKILAIILTPMKNHQRRWKTL